jgi:hypothetical protein
MRTKNLLASASATSAQSSIETARQRGWTDALIAKHGNAKVKAALKGTVGASKRAKAAKVVNYKPKRASAPKAVKEQAVVKYEAAETLKVKLVRPSGEEGAVEAVELSGLLRVFGERPKRVGKGTTNELALVVAGEIKSLTMSIEKLASLKAGKPTWLWYGGKGHLTTLVQ